MATVLFFIHIPYEKNSRLNDEIIRKKHYWEGDAETDGIVSGEKESVQSDTEQGDEGENIFHRTIDF